jgi:hypothetical protein
MNLSISSRKIAFWLLVAVLILNLASFVARVIENLLGYVGTSELVRLINVSEEGNITTWFSALLLLFSAVLFALIAWARSGRGDSYVRHWNVLAIIFLFMSVDEAARIHELTQGPLRSLLHPSGIFHYPWVIVAIPLVLIFVVAYLGFLRHLPKDTTRLLILAGALYVVGALGMDMIGGLFIDQTVGGQKVLPLIQTVEEFLENVGIVVLIYALLSYIQAYLQDDPVSLQFT